MRFVADVPPFFLERDTHGNNAESNTGAFGTNEWRPT
jgi:hypothetical protein